MRLWCWLSGCDFGPDEEEWVPPGYEPSCPRCRSLFGTNEAYHRPLLSRLRWVFWPRFLEWLGETRHYVVHRCAQCYRPVWFSRDSCCSDECHDKYIPF
jgi:hypothetical protein